MKQTLRSLPTFCTDGGLPSFTGKCFSAHVLCLPICSCKWTGPPPPNQEQSFYSDLLKHGLPAITPPPATSLPLCRISTTYISTWCYFTRWTNTMLFLLLYLDPTCSPYYLNHIPLPRRKTPCPFATMWMEPEPIILREISQYEKDEYHMISHIRGI